LLGKGLPLSEAEALQLFDAAKEGVTGALGAQTTFLPASDTWMAQPDSIDRCAWPTRRQTELAVTRGPLLFATVGALCIAGCTLGVTFERSEGGLISTPFVAMVEHPERAGAWLDAARTIRPTSRSVWLEEPRITQLEPYVIGHTYDARAADFLRPAALDPSLVPALEACRQSDPRLEYVELVRTRRGGSRVSFDPPLPNGSRACVQTALDRYFSVPPTAERARIAFAFDVPQNGIEVYPGIRDPDADPETQLALESASLRSRIAACFEDRHDLADRMWEMKLTVSASGTVTEAIPAVGRRNPLKRCLREALLAARMPCSSDATRTSRRVIARICPLTVPTPVPVDWRVD
jgi:hypothetical protein